MSKWGYWKCVLKMPKRQGNVKGKGTASMSSLFRRVRKNHVEEKKKGKMCYYFGIA